MKLKKEIELEYEVVKRLWDSSHYNLNSEEEIYYQGVMTAFEWMLGYYENPYIPTYKGPFSHN